MVNATIIASRSHHGPSRPDAPPTAPADLPSTDESLRARLVDQMIRLVNDDAMTLDAGNAVLETLHLPALPGPGVRLPRTGGHTCTG